MAKWVPILDNGHGGLIGGEYQTPGKRSPNWPLGVLYEGMFNRWVVNRLLERLDRAGVPYFHASPELEDVPLATRAQRVNSAHLPGCSTYLLSVHANAGGGEGLELYTSRGKTRADQLAEVFLAEFAEMMPELPIRRDLSDGDGDKEANFYMLQRVRPPAMLLEVAFMDNPDDYRRLWHPPFLEEVVEVLATVILSLYHQE